VPRNKQTADYRSAQKETNSGLQKCQERNKQLTTEIPRKKQTADCRNTHKEKTDYRNTQKETNS
jgi:hypothetical protein